MSKKREDFLFVSAMLRAREASMLSREKAERMLDAATVEESAKLLCDCGYEDLSGKTAAEVDRALSERREAVFYELSRQPAAKPLVELFRVKYDYHNAKTVLKAEATGGEPLGMMSASGRVAPEKLLEAYREERWTELPPRFGKAMAEGREILARSENPQLMDFALDRAQFEELQALVGQDDNAFLRGYVALLSDSTNLKSAVRTVRMGKNADFLSDALVPGGKLDARRLLACAPEALPGLFAGSVLGDAAVLGAEAAQGGSMTAFELACDNAVTRYLRGAKMIAYGEEAVIAYLAALENELTAVRMILTGKLAGIPARTIRERLRDFYA